MPQHFWLTVLIPFTPGAVLTAGREIAFLFFLSVLKVPGIFPVELSFCIVPAFFHFAILKPESLRSVLNIVCVAGLFLYFSAFIIQFPHSRLFPLLEHALYLFWTLKIITSPLPVEDAVFIGNDGLRITSRIVVIGLAEMGDTARHIIDET